MSGRWIKIEGTDGKNQSSQFLPLSLGGEQCLGSAQSSSKPSKN